MKKLIFFILLNFLFIIHINAQNPNFSGGDGSKENPFLISNSTDLVELSSFVMKDTSTWNIEIKNTYNIYFKLVKDINMNNIDFSPIGGWSTDSISDQTKNFAGYFDGNNKTISNLLINKSNYKNTDYIGLFGSAIGGEIKNTNVKIEIIVNDSSSFIGGIAGYSTSDISNCFSDIIITGGNRYVGGLIGFSSAKNILNCSSNSVINTKSNGKNIGGFIGSSKSKIENSFSLGTLIANKNSYCIGGFTGYNNGLITDCYAHITIHTGDKCEQIGGFVGYNDSVIAKSYNIGWMKCLNDNSSIGGFVGYNTKKGKIYESYSNRGISASDNIFAAGGFIGLNSDGDISNCYSTGYVNTGDNAWAVGGFAGLNKSSIMNSYSIGGITSGNNSEYIDGFIGLANTNSNTINCYTTLNQNSNSNNGVSGDMTKETLKANLLNAEQNPTPWTNDVENINYGFPILGISQPSVSLNNVDKDDIEVKIYPNPVKDILNISIEGNAQFILFNTQGKLIINKTISNETKINTSNLRNGIYVYNIIIDGKKKSGKIIKL